MGKKKEKLPWSDSWQCQRIQEILKDYWLSEPDELYVGVDMTFLKANGEWQKKHIVWFNPNYKRKRDPGESIFSTITAEDIKHPPKIEIPFLDDLKNGKIVKALKDD